MQFNQKEIKKLLQKEDPVILEIGAHKGFDTERFLKEFKEIRIYCFEPDPRCIQAFKNSISDKRCGLIEAAVSNKNGRTTLYLSSGHNPGRFSRFYNLFTILGIAKYLFKQEQEWDFSSTIKNPISNSSKYPWLSFHKTVEIKTLTLDAWVHQNNINYIDLIWADVQGAEKDVIEGASNTLKTVKYFFTEYGETETYPEAMTREETIELLEEFNFEILPQYSSNGKRGDLLFKNKSL